MNHVYGAGCGLAHGSPPPGRFGKMSRSGARLWQTITQNAAWAEAHAVLDQLEREAMHELQMELAGLLGERADLLDDLSHRSGR